jgi:hypothetical protein
MTLNMALMMTLMMKKKQLSQAIQRSKEQDIGDHTSLLKAQCLVSISEVSKTK